MYLKKPKQINFSNNNDIKIKLKTRDITLGDTIDTIPERIFIIKKGFEIEFDGKKLKVDSEFFEKCYENKIEDFQLNTTPSYQLFYSGIHLTEVLGINDCNNDEIIEVFKRLVGKIELNKGKKGQLFFIPNGILDDNSCFELFFNGKIFSIDLFKGEESIGTRYFVPYVNPIGFKIPVSENTKDKFLQISRMI